MCMKGLNRTKASIFYKNEFESAAKMTAKSGIRGIFPDSAIDDYAFDPCGYSMNSAEEAAVTTIHITPEDDFSYASFEALGYNPKTVNVLDMIDKVIKCFEPTEFSLAIYTDGHEDAEPLWQCNNVKGYKCWTDNVKAIKYSGGSLMFSTFVKLPTFPELPHKEEMGEVRF